MGRVLYLAGGLLAQLSTVALVCDSVVLATHIPDQHILRATSLCTAILEGIIWITLALFTSTVASISLSARVRHSSPKKLSIAFGCTLLLCIIASAISITSIVNLSYAADRGISTVTKDAFLAASSVILAVAVACQLLFLSLYYLHCRRQAPDGAESICTIETPSPKSYVKSIAYERTRPSTSKSRSASTMDSFDMVSLKEKKSRVQVMASPRTSSQSLRPATSRSRLVSLKDKQRPPSLDSSIFRPSCDANDSWDATSGHSAQEMPSPTLLAPPRPLETIPASPLLAETPVLDSSSIDLEPPPPIRPRSRSYSPAGRKTSSIRSIPRPSSQQSEEQNIHPLFRSDSPTPPPVATPGTSVMASPDAGKVIAQRPSNQSLRRLRSSSVNSSSPLSRKSSFEAPSLRKPVDECSITEVDEEGDETETESQHSPPIPDFVMGAGCRLSLTRYNSNKTVKDSEGSP